MSLKLLKTYYKRYKLKSKESLEKALLLIFTGWLCSNDSWSWSVFNYKMKQYKYINCLSGSPLSAIIV